MEILRSFKISQSIPIFMISSISKYLNFFVNKNELKSQIYQILTNNSIFLTQEVPLVFLHNDLNKWLKSSSDINLINSIMENSQISLNKKLIYYEKNTIITKSLNLLFFVQPTPRLFRIIIPILLDENPYSSSLLIHLIQSFIYLTPQFIPSILDSLFSLNIFNPSQLYIYGSSLCLIFDSISYQKFQLSKDQFQFLFDWILILLCSNIPTIRDFGMKLIYLSENLFSMNQITLNKFIKENDSIIFQKTMKKLFSIVLSENTNQIFEKKFSDIIFTKSILIHHILLSSFFITLNESEFKIFIPHSQALILTIVQTFSNEDLYFKINLLNYFI